jgi:hypothetical protein
MVVFHVLRIYVYDLYITLRSAVLEYVASSSGVISEYLNLMFMWPCIVDIVKVKNRLDATSEYLIEVCVEKSICDLFLEVFAWIGWQTHKNIAVFCPGLEY